MTQIYGEGTAKSLGSHFSMDVFVGLLSVLRFLNISLKKLSSDLRDSTTANSV